MKLTSIIIDNLFSYNGKQVIPFSSITCIIGSNGFGKTSILNAIKLGLGHYKVTLESILNNKAKIILPQKSRQFKKKSNSFPNQSSQAVISLEFA